MSLPKAVSTSTARQMPTPKTYSGWALDQAIIIDCACSGTLASSLYFGPARRQATFMLFAALDWLGQEHVAEQLRRTTTKIDEPGLSNAALIGRAIVLLRRPRDLLRAVFGEVPAGILGAMQRLGHDPIGDTERYRELHRLFSSRDPQDRSRVKVLGQMSGRLVGGQIDIVSLLDPVLLHPALLSKVYEVKQASELNHVLAFVRQRCSNATDAAIRDSLSRSKSDEHCHTAFKAWAKRFDRVPRTLDTRGDPTLIVLDTAEAIVDAALRYGNCLASKIAEAFVGMHLYVEYRPEHQAGVIIELRATSQGFYLEGLHARNNCRVRADRARVVREKLAACGVALLARAPGDDEMLEAVGNVLGLYRYTEPDNTDWGDETEIGDEEVQEDAARPQSEAA